jgi:hypothetical protein
MLNRLLDVPQLLDVACGERNAGACSTQRQGHCFAESFTGSCDYRHLTGQVVFVHLRL